MRRTFIHLTITVLLGLGAVLAAVGCNEQQMRQADQIVADVNDIAAGVGAVIQSPAGGMIPPPFKELAALGIMLATGGAATYQTWRKKQMAKTTRAIVRGIETIDREHRQANPNPARDIKNAIGVEMAAAGIKSAGNKIVENLKLS